MEPGYPPSSCKLKSRLLKGVNLTRQVTTLLKERIVMVTIKSLRHGGEGRLDHEALQTLHQALGVIILLHRVRIDLREINHLAHTIDSLLPHRLLSVK